MSGAQSLMSSYDSTLNGADPEGRWQVAQCSNTIGATSLVNETGPSSRAAICPTSGVLGEQDQTKTGIAAS